VPRRYVACDHCDAGAWIGCSGERCDGWCEACQNTQPVSAYVPHPTCTRCGSPLTLDAPRFEELYGALQDLVAVLEAWGEDPGRLTPLVPERPRFLTDLSPPEPRPDDAPATRSAFEALRAGAFADARRELERLLTAEAVRRPDPRIGLALGIARQQMGDLAGAEAAFDLAVAAEPDDRQSRLDRGALRARRGDFTGAQEDFARAGDGREARWNRAARIVLEAVASGLGLPDARRLDAARAEAGEPSSYWSDHTVGRLLFTALVERARARGTDPCADARTLRAAERELEFDTFDDRALVLLGYATLELADDAARVAAPLVAASIARLAAEPYARGEAGRWLAAALVMADSATRAGRPADALATLRPLLERDDLRRYRFPCARCGIGTIGVERVEDE
jgi:tetratricopeptide (TPR) repeat protein